MAELIPMEYRIRTARSQLIGYWIVATIVSLILGGGAIAFMIGWKAEQAQILAKENAQYQEKRSLIQRAKELRQSRLELASRMEKIQQLMDDKTLLLLLRNISESFSSNDCLQFVSIDAHGRVSSVKNDDPNQFMVRIDGITSNTSTLAELMTRLKKSPTPPMSVTPETSRRENMLDGQVMRFQIVCEKADPAGT